MKKSIPLLLFAAVAVQGCASKPPFDCESARSRVLEADADARKTADEYHAAEAQKDGKYHAIHAARTITCVGTLGIMCGMADQIAADNTRIEETAKRTQKHYAELTQLAVGLRKAMEANSCDDIPPPPDN